MANNSEIMFNGSVDSITLSKILYIDGNIIRTAEGILCEVLVQGVIKFEGEKQNMYVSEEFLKEGGLLTTETEVAKVSKPVIVEWGEPETKLMLDKYEQYIAQVGPFKKFKNKKNMWQKVSSDLSDILCIPRSATQCESRFKTVLKRKVKTCKENSVSGATRTEVEFEEELNKIKAKDDSIQPEIFVGVGEVKKCKEPTRLKQKRKKPKEESNITKVLYKIHEEKERAKERRHQEKMTLIEALLRKDD